MPKRRRPSTTTNSSTMQKTLLKVYIGTTHMKSAHTALAVKACLLGGKTATLNAQ